MSDRIKGFCIVLDRDYKDEDAEIIKNAILMIKGVYSVDNLVIDHTDHFARQSLKREYLEKIIKIFD